MSFLIERKKTTQGVGGGGGGEESVIKKRRPRGTEWKEGYKIAHSH